MTDEEIAKLSPLRLPIVQKLLAIGYGAAELPALVWDSKRFHEASGPPMRPANSSRSAVPTTLPFWNNCGGRMERCSSWL
jgi:hypothetical protein